jgi:hypothetical protein
MSIDNDADWRRAFAFWLLLVTGNIALVLTYGFCSLVYIQPKTQIYVFLVISGILLSAFLLGRWRFRPSEEGTERWRIGSWMTSFMLLEFALCILTIAGRIRAVLMHYRWP